MAREMALDTFRQETFATALTPPGEGGASTLGSHPRPKAMLLLAGSFRWLISAFHKAENFAGRELRAVTLGWGRGLSI